MQQEKNEIIIQMLSTEHFLSVYAMYMFQPVRFEYTMGDEPATGYGVLRGISYLSGNEDLLHIKHDSNDLFSESNIDDCDLLLLPVSKIILTDAIEIARMIIQHFDKNFYVSDCELKNIDERFLTLVCMPNEAGKRLCVPMTHIDFRLNGQYTLWNVNSQNTWTSLHGYSDEIKEYSQMEYIKVREFLIKHGYAVPLFFEPNHPLNGKTAIEIGVAVDATKIF